MALDVGPQNPERGKRDVGGEQPGAGQLEGEGDGDAAGTGTDVEDAWSVRQLEGQSGLDQVLGLRPWDQHPRIDEERAAIEFLLAEEVGDGLALPAAFDERSESSREIVRDRLLGPRPNAGLGQPQDVTEE